MGAIVPFPDDRHHDIQLLLPWYATGQLDAADCAAVEAHLAECVLCSSDLASEPALRHALESETAEAECGWEALNARLNTETPIPSPEPRRETRGRWATISRAASQPRVLRWAVAAQFVALIGFGTASLTTAPRTDTYRALSNGPAVHEGNVL